MHCSQVSFTLSWALRLDETLKENPSTRPQPLVEFYGCSGYLMRSSYDADAREAELGLAEATRNSPGEGHGGMSMSRRPRARRSVEGFGSSLHCRTLVPTLRV